MSTAGRKRRVAAAIAKAGTDALLVTAPADVRYLTGFTGSNGAVCVLGGRMALFTDGRYTTQAADEVQGAKVHIVTEKSVSVSACEWAATLGAKSCGYDSTQMTVAGFDVLRRAVKQGRSWLVPVGGLVARIREIKDSLEIELMREAAALGVRLFEESLEFVVPGATENEIAMAIEYQARMAGAERMSFETIVASGERSALPHGRATNAKLPRRGFVTLDFGVVLDGYCSDMTRTVHLGKARAGEREAYEAVLEAQEAGIAAVQAGVSAAQVDEAARASLEAAGMAEWFTHSTGHGVGLEIHEAPRLGKKSTETLQAGMVVTIEPGVYLPGRFGIRIEDTVLVTRGGCENLTPATKAWIEL